MVDKTLSDIKLGVSIIIACHAVAFIVLPQLGNPHNQQPKNPTSDGHLDCQTELLVLQTEKEHFSVLHSYELYVAMCVLHIIIISNL